MTKRSTEEVTRIAAGLTKAQQSAVISGNAATEQDGLALFKMGLTRRDLRSRVKVYSDLGLAIRAHLLEADRHD